MNRIVASAQISLMDYNDAIVTGNMPANPEKDMLWLNTSVNPHVMKQYTGSEWITVGELDPEYTEKLEVITGNITNLELTLSNMADDGKLDYGDRQEIVDKLLPVIGYLPVNTSVTLKTVNQLDADKKGSFYQLRQAAQNAGIVPSNTAYTGLASAWNALRTYLGGLDPKPWDLSTGTTGNQDAVAQVDKGTFRTHWLNYYNAEYTLATATTQILHSAISTINTTTLPAMRDSALSSGEKAAIKQSLIILSSEKTAMDGEILGLKANPKLENQTPLNKAKSAYDTSYTGVTTAINAVLAVPTGTLIPSNLILEVENAVSSYSAKLSLLKKAMQDSQTAIAKKVSDDASKELSDSLKGYVDKITYGQDIEEIQNQVDGAIMTWFGDNEPTLLTAPTKEWSTTALKDVHLGDLYYDNKSGYAYRFGKDGTRYLWIRIVDADVVAALAAAQNAQDTADGKRRAFYNQPTPPYDAGDLWLQGEKGELKRAVITRDKNGLYHENDWVKAVKYTDDTAVENLEIGGRNLILQSQSEIEMDSQEPRNWLELNLSSELESGLYTTSFEAKTSNGTDIFYASLARGSSSIVFFDKKIKPTKEFTRFYFTVENTGASTINTLIISNSINYMDNADNTGILTIKENSFKLEKGNKATDWTPAPEDVEKAIKDSQTAAENYANTIKTGLETQIDGKVETYNQTANPATSWTAEEKTKHKGDLWYHPTNKITKLWSGSSWTTLEDAVATGAQQLAQAKKRVFVNTPTTPYEIGDLWVQGTSGDLMRCATSRASGSFNINDWAKATKYTDDTTAKAAATAASNAQTAANNAQTDATKANNAVSDIISDNKMTPDEKVILQREWLNIQYERNEILSQAERYVIDNASYRSVYDTLSGYLAPFFTNLTTTQNVNGETLRSNFQRYYEQRQAILDAISVAAQQKVLDLQTQVDAGPFADKTNVLSGTEIFTDKADDSVVHVDIDGKSVGGGSGKNLVTLFSTEAYSSSTNVKIESDKKVSLTSTHGNPVSTMLKPKSPAFRRAEAGEYTLSFNTVDPNIPVRSVMLVKKSNGDNIVSGVSGHGLYNTAYEGFYLEGYGSGGGTVKRTFTLPPETHTVAVALQVTHAGDATTPPRTNVVYDVQLEKGSVVTAYEPPAPTPDYPIAIHSLNDFDVVSSVGRRNLYLDGSYEKNKLHEVRSPNWKISDENPIFGKSVLKCIENSGNNSYHGKDINITGKSTYSASVWVYVSEDWQGNHVALYIEKAKPSLGGSVSFDRNKKGQWQKLTRTGVSGTEDTFARVLTYVFGQTSGYVLFDGLKFENSGISTDYNQHSEEIEPDTYTPTLYKTNLLLSEPLRSVGDVKDRLFLDSDGLWKIERNVGNLSLNGSHFKRYPSATIAGLSKFYTTSIGINSQNSYKDNSPLMTNQLKMLPVNEGYAGREVGISTYTSRTALYGVIPSSVVPDTESEIIAWFNKNPLVVLFQKQEPTIENLPQSDQDKFNNIASFKGSNYLYTIVDKTNILPSYVRENLRPNLRATFKSQTWYQNYKRGDDLRHFVEVKGLDRAIRFGMLVDYQSFAMPIANWLYFCKIQTSTNDFREELVDEDGSIFDYTTQREIKVPKQALDLRGVAEGTTGYLAFDTRNQLMWFIHYQRNYTNTTNQKTGIIEKIPSSEYWIKWNPGKTGHNTQLVLDESVYIVGEIER